MPPYFNTCSLQQSFPHATLCCRDRCKCGKLIISNFARVHTNNAKINTLNSVSLEKYGGNFKNEILRNMFDILSISSELREYQRISLMISHQACNKQLFEPMLTLVYDTICCHKGPISQLVLNTLYSIWTPTCEMVVVHECVRFLRHHWLTKIVCRNKIGWCQVINYMMTSSNIFRVTGPLWGESAGERYRWAVDSPLKGQWLGALMFSLICA